MEDRHPKGTLVTIEEEPQILQRLQIANDMRLPCRRIALGTHDSNLLPLASHIPHNQRMPKSLVTSSRINQYITWLHLTNLARFRLPARRESAATAIRLAKETLQCLTRATTLILQPLDIQSVKVIATSDTKRNLWLKCTKRLTGV